MHCCFVQQSPLRFSAFLRPFSARFLHPTKRCYHFGDTTILRYPTIRCYHRLLGLRPLSLSSALLPVRMDGGANVRSVATTVPNHTRFRDKTFKENIHKLRSQFQKRKQQFHDNVLTIPNALCILRIGLTPLIGYLVVEQCFVSALGVFTIAGATDLLDGYIARHMKGQSSLLGSMLDPVADKLLVSTLFITLTYVNLIPLLLTTVVIMRDICLITGGFIKRYRLLLPPITLQRYFDPSVSPIKVAPTIMSKVNTALQLSLVAGALASPVFHFVGHPYLTVLCFATGATTIISGLQYAMVDRMKRVHKR